jgi:hypothetical protein
MTCKREWTTFDGDTASGKEFLYVYSESVWRKGNGAATQYLQRRLGLLPTLLFYRCEMRLSLLLLLDTRVTRGHGFGVGVV